MSSLEEEGSWRIGSFSGTCCEEGLDLVYLSGLTIVNWLLQPTRVTCAHGTSWKSGVNVHLGLPGSG